jgi:hypothetical protein
MRLSECFALGENFWFKKLTGCKKSLKSTGQCGTQSLYRNIASGSGRPSSLWLPRSFPLRVSHDAPE